MHTELILQHIQDSIDTKTRLMEDERLVAEIDKVAQLIVEAYRNGHKTLWAGNGGTTATKLTLESLDSRLSLSTDTSIITAVGNDFGFDRLFARQVEAQGCPGDVFIGISTSGKSRNLVEALGACRAKGITTVAIVGENPCPMDEYDHVIHLPSRVTPRIQECQTLVGHILCYLVENQLFGA